MSDYMAEIRARVAELDAALAGLLNDCLAPDFNEHWSSYKQAEKVRVIDRSRKSALDLWIEETLAGGENGNE